MNINRSQLRRMILRELKEQAGSAMAMGGTDEAEAPRPAVRKIVDDLNKAADAIMRLSEKDDEMDEDVLEQIAFGLTKVKQALMNTTGAMDDLSQAAKHLNKASAMAET